MLYLTSPPFNGDDVFILQNVIVRSSYVTNGLNASRSFDQATKVAVQLYQAGNGVKTDGIFGPDTAKLLLQQHLNDGYRDNGTVPPGWKYKVYVPVHRNRSIETTGTLFDANGKVLYRFLTHTHGQNDAQGNALNDLAGDGSTPTGLSTFDLNSPEPDPVDFGPYPVNRAVMGLEGNAGIVISNIRDGILMHTGEWPDWNPSMEMPNSHGCIHTHPTDCNQIWQILVGLGVQIRNNTFGKLPYPYAPQGLLSLEQID